MGKEKERKFLVDHNKWKHIYKPKGELYKQGYLLTESNKTIRVSQTTEKGFLAVKEIIVGTTRFEYEYEIPKHDALELINNFSNSELLKIRYKIIVDNMTWEVDEFLGENEGLIIAEIELTNENNKFLIPEWVDKEVTGQEKYYNTNLTVKPYKNWIKPFRDIILNERCIIELQHIKSFFERYNFMDWVEKSDKAIQLIGDSHQDLNIILQNYFGQGNGSFFDIWISEINGFKLAKSAQETNDELSILSANLLQIKQKLE